MTDETPHFFPIHAASGAGLYDEFCGAAFQSMMDLMNHNEDLWNLPGGDVCQGHGFAHTLVALSAMIDPCSETMKKVAYGPTYQGDVDMECLVFGVQVAIENMSGADEDCFNRQLNKESISDYISRIMLMRQKSEFIHEQRRIGRKGAFYIGKKTGQAMLHVQEIHRFDNDHIYNAAKELAREHGELARWDADIYDCDSYVADDGQRQYFRASFNFSDDIGCKIMIERIAGTLFALEDQIWGVSPVGEFTRTLTGADVLSAMKRGNDLPHNLRFEQQFGL